MPKEENALTVVENAAPAVNEKPMSSEMMLAQVQTVQTVLKTVMKKGVHYDVIEGCGEKPVLLKPGAEKINMVFHIGSEPVIDRECDGFDTHFHIRTRMFHIPTGKTLGFGVGEGSTLESKWAWRKALCHEEFETTLETHRRLHWKPKYVNRKPVFENGKAVYEAVEQVRQNPADIINTVLKMAVKRAEVDGCRKVTACSDVFEVDWDEDHLRAAVNGNEGKAETENRYSQPRRKPDEPQESKPATSESPALISENQWKRLYAIGKQQGLSNKEMNYLVYESAGVNRSDEIPLGAYEEVVENFQKAQPGKVLPE